MDAHPGRQPLDQDLGRSARQDDHIEPRMEADLVLLTPGDEQHVRVLDGQELLDGVLPPPLAAVRKRLTPPVADATLPAHDPENVRNDLGDVRRRQQSAGS